MSEKSLSTKIGKFEEKERRWKETKSSLKAELRRTRGRLKEVCENRDKWRSQYREQENSIKSSKVNKRVGGGVNVEKISGHKYSTLVVTLCISIYILGNCGLRSSIKILTCLCIIGGLELGKLPVKVVWRTG